jgi:hypothetical protein
MVVREWFADIGVDSRACSQAAEHIVQIPELSSPYLCRRREKMACARFKLAADIPRVGSVPEMANHDEVARRVIVVGGIPNPHSEAAPADELRM